ncbi:hypothetical protein EOA32_01045 [Mesorhizobium sp. M1A.F.Ca.ET.072.01.1.1]|uniref:hypothetical protein n=1 Tax=Mesorhizobium sp. M1A.F.Ca.ET.072.01.1.1 TaxID=2496753 RepID=UPI000FD605E5|nr:hypothetical protein [Mesorhizobium sp. M1A.F.Ca.ET.072.01.1.1]RUW55636.1 hypothetical protein EOA32_01045 [Mesorhizobium sp. M1A.F.Ca.ET.072.01.1.1]
MNEEAVTSHVRLAYADIGPLWRNNVGVLKDQRGVPVRFGLANESANMNREIKSSDWIGITPVTAYLQSCGWVTLGVFTALEMKKTDWQFKPGDPHTDAQAKFHALVREAGGFAGFVTKPEDIHSIIRRG